MSGGPEDATKRPKLIVVEKKRRPETQKVAAVVTLSPSFADSLNEIRCQKIYEATGAHSNFHALTPLYTKADAEYWAVMESMEQSRILKERETATVPSSAENSDKDLEFWAMLTMLELAKQKADQLDHITNQSVPVGPPFFNRTHDLFDRNSATALFSKISSAKTWINPFSAISAHHAMGMHGNSRDDLFCSCETPAWAFSLSEKQLLPVCSNVALISALADEMKSALGERSYMPYCNLAFLAYFNQSEVDDPNRSEKSKFVDEDGKFADGVHILDLQQMMAASERHEKEAGKNGGGYELELKPKDAEASEAKNEEEFQKKKLLFAAALMSLNTTMVPNVRECNRLIKNLLLSSTENADPREEPTQSEDTVVDAQEESTPPPPTCDTINPNLAELGITRSEHAAEHFQEVFIIGTLLALRREIEIGYAILCEKTDDILEKCGAFNDRKEPKRSDTEDSKRKEIVAKLSRIIVKTMKGDVTFGGDDEDDTEALYASNIAEIFNVVSHHIKDVEQRAEETDDRFTERVLNDLLDNMRETANRDPEVMRKALAEIAVERSKYEKMYLECFSDVTAMFVFLAFLRRQEGTKPALYALLSDYVEKYYIGRLQRLAKTDKKEEKKEGEEADNATVETPLCVAMGVLPMLYHPTLESIRRMMAERFPEALRHGFEQRGERSYKFSAPYTDKVVNMAPWDDFYDDDTMVVAKGIVPKPKEDKMIFKKTSGKKNKERQRHIFSIYQSNHCCTTSKFMEEGEQQAYRCEFGGPDYMFFSSTLYHVACSKLRAGNVKGLSTFKSRVDAVFDKLFFEHRKGYEEYVSNNDTFLKSAYEIYYSAYCVASKVPTLSEEKFVKHPFTQFVMTFVNISTFEKYWIKASANQQNALQAAATRELPLGKVLRILITEVNDPIRRDFVEQMDTITGNYHQVSDQNLNIPYLNNHIYHYLKNQSWLATFLYDMLAMENATPKEDGSHEKSKKPIFGSYDVPTAWALLCASRRYARATSKNKEEVKMDVHKFLQTFGMWVERIGKELARPTTTTETVTPMEVEAVESK